MKSRLPIAMACYALLATLAAFTLTGVFLAGVLVILAGLAAKTWIGTRMQKSE